MSLVLDSIRLTNFKSYARAEFACAPKLNIIYGLNGVGKTNLLDAIHILSMTRSYLSVPDKQLVKEGADFFRLEGNFTKQGKDLQIVCKFGKGVRKTIEKNTVAYSRLSDHIGIIPVVMITPDDVQLVNGSNTDRRRFTDATLSQIDRNYLNQLMDYNRLLKQRNAILKQFQEERRFDEVLLDSYDHRMDPLAHSIHNARKTFFFTFALRLQEHYATLSKARENVEIRYQSQLDQKQYLQVAEELRQKDRVMGRSHAGPHRDKIEILLEDRTARVFASQGQKKSTVFAMKLAQYESIMYSQEVPPLLLLDDIFDKLDRERVAQLLNIILRTTFGQVFITDTQLDRISPLLSDMPVDFKSIRIQHETDAK